MTKEDVGPIEARQWPRELVANALDRTATGGRLFGFDVEADLARNYRFSDVVYLGLTGDLPDDARSRAFEVALIFATSLGAGEAPVHAAMLARLCGVRAGGTLAVGALSLGEKYEAILRELAAATGSDSGPLPDSLSAKDDAERASVGRLRESLSGLLEVPMLARDPSREVALVATLRACGLRPGFPIASALTMAGLTATTAESARVVMGRFKDYPMDTPPFDYDAASRPASGTREQP